MLRSRTAAACPRAWMQQLWRCCVSSSIEDNDALLREYRERLAERTGVTVCLAVICEALKRLKLRPKKRPFGRPSRSGPRLPPSARLIASR